MKDTDNIYFVDFHCHSSVRAMNTSPVYGKENMWSKTRNAVLNSPVSGWVRGLTRGIAKESQSNLQAYAENNTRVVIDSIYPIEKGWYNLGKVPGFKVGKKLIDDIFIEASGINRQRLQELLNQKSYFLELERIYEFLLSGQGTSPDKKFTYKLVKNYEDLKSTISKTPNTIAMILSVEGAHALESGSLNTLDIPLKEHKKYLTANIRKIKGWEYPPLFINLSHHYWNQLSGHSRSMKSPVNLLFDQNYGIDMGITDLGWHVIEELLSRSNGKRIFIDIKHMSLIARKEYYAFIQRNNYINNQDKIPIISSHSGVNGYKTMDNSIRADDSMRKFKNSYFNNWSINLSEEEIKIIHESGGAIGVMLDKSVLASPGTLKKIDSLKNRTKRKESFIKLILDNIFFIVKAIGEKSGWNVPVLGSDYDGLINHIDNYKNATKLPSLYKDLIEYLKKYQYESELWFGKSPEEIVNKFMRDNSIDFLKQHFV